MKLTQAQLDHFETQGYLVVPDVLSGEGNATDRWTSDALVCA